MKKILGLDLGTTSIGWAFVNEAEKDGEISSIIKTGVRVVPLSTDEQQDFKKGNSITINADRTLKRGARRNLQRYKQRREAVIQKLIQIGFIFKNETLAEDGKNTTHETYKTRSIAVDQRISKKDFAKVLLMINKKRGYKSSRKANNQEEGQLIDGMAIAKRLHNEKLTPGQLSLLLLKDGKKSLPTYYRSDLKEEFDRIWAYQSSFYPEHLTPKHKEGLNGLGQRASITYFEKTIGTQRAENKGKDKKFQEYGWRSNATKEQLDLSEIAFILTELNNQINQSSGYLGAISDRSKELYFNDLTVGQYLYQQLQKDPLTSLKNQVFYRQDYMDEFDAIWREQSKHYSELTEDVRKELRDITIFYQRRLKSQKGLINICEFEGRDRELIIDGAKKKKFVGPRVAPKSSIVFQQAKVWQNINAIILKNEHTNETKTLDQELKELLFAKLNIANNLSDKEVLKYLTTISDIKAKEWQLNFEKIEGNRTFASLYKIFEEIADIEGYPEISKKKDGKEIQEALEMCFSESGINTSLLEIDLNLTGNEFSKQPAYELWHLLYSYEDDNSPTGIERLLIKLQDKFGFKAEHAKLLSNLAFQDDYGSLSVRALRKIYPFLEEGKMYNEACTLAGYNHSNSITTPENKKRPLVDTIEILKKNSLRNPVVEKILNQMIHVVNAIIAHPEMGRPDEIRVELARELKKTAKQRNEMTKQIGSATKANEEIRAYLKKEIGLKYVSRKDIIKYKLYQELASIGHKTLYSGTYVELKDLFFSNTFDVEHIIPQSVMFDDSFSNKTIELREINLEKGAETAIDYCDRKGWGDAFNGRVQEVFKSKGIKYGKLKKLLMTKEEVPSDFLNRDLGNTAYISKKAAALLTQVTRTVLPTTGNITAKLRSDWELINVLQELNWDKYKAVGLTYYEYNKVNQALPRIKDWTKRNDHRHHAMDAITVAFTRPAFVQYLNNMSGQSEKGIIAQKIKEKYTYRNKEGGRKFIKPYENIREDAKKHLSEILISHKTKNKVVTRNKNKIKIKGKNNYKIQKTLTPRGQLHKETIYGKSKYYVVKDEKINGTFDQKKIATITNPTYRNVLSERLRENENDPKKAFTGKNALTKNPIFIEGTEDNIPLSVKTEILESQYTIRKEINPDLKVDKVVDKGIQRILQKRLADFEGKPKLAFMNLDENPIWLNKEKGIYIKRVTITGVSNAESLHTGVNLNGQEIVNKEGVAIPKDFVSTGKNHHIAIYENQTSDLDDESVSFFEAVERRNQNQPIIRKQNKDGLPLKFTLKQNEMFLFPSRDFQPLEVDLISSLNKNLISKNLFRVQKISKVTYGNSSVRDYVFRHHLETEVKDIKDLKDLTWKSVKSLVHLREAVKVRLNHLGEIVYTGEY